MTANRRPIGAIESLRNTRRSIGDGTLGGRSRIATPKQAGNARSASPASVISATPGEIGAIAGSGGIAIGLVASGEIPDGGGTIEWATWDPEITQGFQALQGSIPESLLPCPVDGITQATLHFAWGAVDHGADFLGHDVTIQVRRDGQTVWQWSSPDTRLPVPRFAADTPKIPYSAGQSLSVRVVQSSGEPQPFTATMSWGIEGIAEMLSVDDPITCWTDFSEYPVGVLTDNDWTTAFRVGSDDEWEVVAESGATGGKIARFNNLTNTDGETVVWDCIPIVSGGEAVGRFRVIDTSQRFVGPVLRARTDAEGGGRGYHCRLGSVGLSFRIVRLDGTTETILADSGISQDPGTWYWIRFRADGSLLRGKIWQHGTSEPGGWTLQVNDTAYGQGRAGLLGTFAPGSSGALRDCDVFGFTIPGTAPMTDPDL